MKKFFLRVALVIFGMVLSLLNRPGCRRRARLPHLSVGVPCLRNVNAHIREIAAATHTPLIDLGQAFRAACENQPCDDLFYYDHHPTAQGHQLAASIIRRQWEASGVG